MSSNSCFTQLSPLFTCFHSKLIAQYLHYLIPAVLASKWIQFLHFKVIICFGTIRGKKEKWRKPRWKLNFTNRSRNCWLTSRIFRPSSSSSCQVTQVKFHLGSKWVRATFVLIIIYLFEWKNVSNICYVLFEGGGLFKTISLELCVLKKLPLKALPNATTYTTKYFVYEPNNTILYFLCTISSFSIL